MARSKRAHRAGDYSLNSTRNTILGVMREHKMTVWNQYLRELCPDLPQQHRDTPLRRG